MSPQRTRNRVRMRRRMARMLGTVARGMIVKMSRTKISQARRSQKEVMEQREVMEVAKMQRKTPSRVPTTTSHLPSKPMPDHKRSCATNIQSSAPPALSLSTKILGTGVPPTKKGKKSVPAAKGSEDKENIGAKKKKPTTASATKSSTAAKSSTAKKPAASSAVAKGKASARPAAKPLTRQRAEAKKRQRAEVSDEDEEVQRPTKRTRTK